MLLRKKSLSTFPAKMAEVFASFLKTANENSKFQPAAEVRIQIDVSSNKSC